MRFYPVRNYTLDNKELSEQYAIARAIGNVRVADSVLFIRARFKTYYIPFTAIKNCFRRVMGVPMKLCCGKGEMTIENLVISDGNEELAQVQLPGTKAALELMALLEEKIPDCEFGYRRPEND